MIMQLGQGITRPSFSVTLCVGLFCERVWCFENFTLCDLDNFDVIIKNTFLDAYKIDIFYNKSKLGICAKVGFRLMNLNVDYSSTLAEMRINFVALVSELESPSFLILMSLKVPMGKLNQKGKNNLLLVF